jgi:hypothetical protein
MTGALTLSVAVTSVSRQEWPSASSLAGICVSGSDGEYAGSARDITVDIRLEDTMQGEGNDRCLRL